MGSIESSNLLPSPDMAALLEATLGSARHPAPRERHWTPADVADLMASLAPPPSGRPGDQSLLRQQLSSAYLAGVAVSQEAMLLKPSRSLVSASIQQARALMKNRAASQEDRLWHAFTAGARAARASASFDLPTGHDDGAEPLKLFIRQPFTESGESQQTLVAEVLAQVEAHNGAPHSFRYLTGRQAESADTFRVSFEAESGQPFTPRAFRAHRLGLLGQADAFINIRVGMSESSAFELAYHVFAGACTPVLFLVWKQAPVKTTLLKDLGNLCDVTYLEFERPQDVAEGMSRFFHRCRRAAARAN
jgi:hypothetical protein